MRIWLVTVGEPLPVGGPANRLLRTGILANMLAERGHSVVWWSSTFDHVRKQHTYPADTTLEVRERLQLRLLHSMTYRTNVSVRRLVNHYGLARKFRKFTGEESRPNLILCSLPTLELCVAAVEYGNRHGIPVVLDVRDLWPDIFLHLVPRWAQGLARLLLSPLFKATRLACKGATAILGITPAFVEWGLQYAGRPTCSLDRDFPLAYAQAAPTTEAVLQAERFWAEQGCASDSREFLVCFFGTLGRQFDLQTVIAAARLLQAVCPSVRFLICGAGDRLGQFRNQALGCRNVLFPGWLGPAEIWTLMRMSSVGIAPYHNSKDFLASIPNKAVEYLSAGLPVVTSLQAGALHELLMRHGCGLSYPNGDAEGLARVLTELHAEPTRLKAMSENAAALYRRRFVAEKVYHEMIDHLVEIAGTRGRYSSSKGAKSAWPPDHLPSKGVHTNYDTVTEVPGLGASGEQLAMLLTRYHLASQYAAGKDVLEVGCGAGIGLGYLANCAHRVVGGDIEDGNLAHARNTYQGWENVEICKLDAMRLPFENAAFDVVLLLEAIYYLPDPGQFLREARRVLRSAGVLIICSANREWAGFNPSPFSVRYYSAGELGELLAGAGFAVALYTGFPDRQSLKARVVSVVRRVAVRLHLIPKTMRGKLWLKRLFFGKLVTLPGMLVDGMAEPRALMPLNDRSILADHKVIYAVGHVPAQPG